MNNNIKTKDWIIIIVLAFIGLTMNEIPYNNTISTILQIGLLGVVFLIYKKRPSMLIVAYIFLSILPSRLFGGFYAEGTSYYSLNAKVAIGFTILFLIYEAIFLKRKIKISLYAFLFVFLVIFSYTITVAKMYYITDFWWICIAYLCLPSFIKGERDIQLVLNSYIIAVIVFCIKTIPILLSGELYRGSLNLDPNYASLFILIGTASVFVILTQYENIPYFYKILLFISLVMFAFSISFFASRTAFIMLALLIMMYLLFNAKSLKTVILSVILIMLSYMVLDQYGVFDSFFLRFSTPNVSTAGGRFIIQKELLEYFYHSNVLRILFGYGFLTANNFGIGMQAHNSYLSILIGFGLIGLLFYTYYLIKIFVNLYKGRYKSFLIIFYLLLIYGFSLEPYHIIEGVVMFCLLKGISVIDT